MHLSLVAYSAILAAVLVFSTTAVFVYFAKPWVVVGRNNVVVGKVFVSIVSLL